MVEVSARPVATPLTRLQAQASPCVTNLRHEPVPVNDFDRQVLRRLDGAHDKQALLYDLRKLASKGALAVRQNNQPVRDAETVHKVLAEALDQNLPRLARSALLVG